MIVVLPPLPAACFGPCFRPVVMPPHLSGAVVFVSGGIFLFGVFLLYLSPFLLDLLECEFWVWCAGCVGGVCAPPGEVFTATKPCRTLLLFLFEFPPHAFSMNGRYISIFFSP